MVVALLLASCAEAVVEDGDVIAPEDGNGGTTPGDGDGVVEPTGPQHGGVFTFGVATAPLYFDEVLGGTHQTAGVTHLTNERLVQGDWTKGPTGTGIASFNYTDLPPFAAIEGGLAESWEISGDTLTFHIRQGVKWHDVPPTNGRELVADDVAFSIERAFTAPTSYQARAYPKAINYESITTPDKYTVVIECKPGKAGNMFAMGADFLSIVPRDAVELYGNLNDWRNAVGTGPFYLTNYVTDSSTTFERNPNYWQNDPFNPENQLPYVETVKQLIIPDLSTRMAAIRTGKIDHLGHFSTYVEWEDAESLIRTNPELKYNAYNPGVPLGLSMRTDNPENPLADIRVRRALAMAVNQQEILDTIYGGNADLLAYPIPPIPEAAAAYTPVEELPESTRELFEYHPDKAMALLADAGYPDGFATSAVVLEEFVDELSIIQAYFADIGVDLEILVKEYGALTGINASKSYENMTFHRTISILIYRMLHVYDGAFFNYSRISDPKIEAAYAIMNDDFFDEAKKQATLKEISPYILDLSLILVLPGDYAYTFWQPWVLGYSGELCPGKQNEFGFIKYLWIDQDLKEEMTGMR
jgi:peptide/nickel transport system substrate-binding protein